MGKKPAAPEKKAPAAEKTPSSPSDRPPRPSHGHVWDAEKGAWVGRGSLDARKAAKLVDAGPREQADGTLLKTWQSMPSQLLLEWTQKEKRPKPFYTNSRSWDRSKYHQKVVLTDPKDKEASLEFTPWDDSETQAVAKEHAALLALLKVQGNLPLDRKLPEPYCKIWKASLAEAKPEARPAKGKSDAKGEVRGKPPPVPPDAEGHGGNASAPPAAAAAAAAAASSSAQRQQHAAAAATAAAEKFDGEGSDEVAVAAPLRAMSQYSSKAERAAAEKKRGEERNKRKALQELKRRADMPAPILLSRKMRAEIYSALGLHGAYESASAAAGEEVEMTDVEAGAYSQCVEWGFESNDVMCAMTAAREEEEAAPSSSSPAPSAAQGPGALAERWRQWLCLHLPEDELPEEFAAGRGQFTVTQAGGQPRRSAKADFAAAKADLAAWLLGELSSRLEDSDARALHASIEAILLTVDASSADDAEAEEAGENMAAILDSEGDKLQGLVQELKERWGSVWAHRHGAEAHSAEDPEVGGAETAGGHLSEPSTKFEAEAAESAHDGHSSGWGPTGPSHSRKKHGSQDACWFGSCAGESGVSASEEACLKSPAGRAMAKQRERLPAAKSKAELLELCRGSPVVLVRGETGCGKTTQVGQFLLDADPKARVVVTQPRRVAAVSVAQRVAEERGETLGRGSVGYSVRGESRLRREACRLLFCTNGVLLRRLLSSPKSMFSEGLCTHLVIDEVHERSVEIDLLLTLLRQALPRRPSLRVLLMSATMDSTVLAAMFPSRPPSIDIPGRTFPVTQLFSEDLEDQFRPHHSGDQRRDAAGEGPRFLGQLDVGAIAEVALAALRGTLPSAPEDGAVLVFVPGVGEIDRVSREIQQRAAKNEAFVLPLHGGLPSDQQRRCFEVPEKGRARKIVVSTNVAETSVTVPDVTVVIDTARERRLQFDAGAAAPCLVEGLCARSSLTQRRGRAGRVRAGLCITLLTRGEYEALPAEVPPEIESAALESLCLQVRVCGFDPEHFLAEMPTPPEVARRARAERMLVKIGAVREETRGGAAEVTALGQHLAALPCDVHLGKLLVVGAFLGVASMALDVAAMLSVRSPLKSTVRDAEAEAWRQRLRQSLRPGGTKSDHCLYARLLQLWSACPGYADRRELCRKAALVWDRMVEASSVRSQLAGGLQGLGFDLCGGGGGGDDRCAGEWRALRVAVTAAFYPHVARVKRPIPDFVKTLAGALEKDPEAKQLRYFVLPDPTEDAAAAPTGAADSATGGWRWRDTRAFLHPASLLFKETSFSCPYVVFSSKQLQQRGGAGGGSGDHAPSTKLSLSDASEASIYALLLFGGALSVDHRESRVTIDGWICFSGGSTTVVALLERLRREIDALLLQKIAEPSLQLGEKAACQVVSTLLSTDGLG